jgi:hypothetical protein
MLIILNSFLQLQANFISDTGEIRLGCMSSWGERQDMEVLRRAQVSRADALHLCLHPQHQLVGGVWRRLPMPPPHPDLHREPFLPYFVLSYHTLWYSQNWEKEVETYDGGEHQSFSTLKL